jgi:hypothetical protein
MRQWFTGETCVALLAAGEATRRTAEDPTRFHDVLYTDLMSDPFGTLATLYDHFGLPFTAEAETRMRDYLASRPKGRHGAHAYRFEDLNLDLESERRRFSDYQKRYGVPSEVGE